MVLQRGVNVPVWGWSHPGAEVSVAFAGQTQSATADATGRWRVVLDPLTASAENRDMTLTFWREAWGIGDFPFYFVQLAPHRRYGGEKLGRMWEAQLHTARKVPNCGMAVISDSNQLKNIHPDNKPAFGRRLALWALAKD